MSDANKTPLTHRVTAVAVASLDSLGCKPVETEVNIAPGWVADVASYWYPSRTEAKRLGMQRIKLTRRLIDDECDDMDMRFRLWGAGPFTVAVEVKTSKADYSTDRKWLMPFPANICILAFPRGVVQEIPHGWHGLETNAAGDKALKWHKTDAIMHSQHPGAVIDFIAQVGIRRDHRTRYRVMNVWAKAYRVQDAVRKKQLSVAKLLDGLAEWLQRPRADRPALRDALERMGIKKPPFYLNEAIEYFEELRIETDTHSNHKGD